MSITNRGKLWEFLNSFWILWSFTLLLNCVGFFWIGGRTGKRKWIVSGCIYLLVDFVLFFNLGWLGQFNEMLGAIAVTLVFIGWSAAILHSFLSRKEYLLRLEAVLDLQKATRDAYRSEIRNEYFGGNTRQPVAPPKQPRPSQPMGQPMPPLQAMLDLNIASEQQLAALPGVGIALAKRAVDLRTQTGWFASADDFCARLQLMPHFAAQIRNLAFASPPATQPKPADNAARIVDI